jgi:hypothetical protein
MIPLSLDAPIFLVTIGVLFFLPGLFFLRLFLKRNTSLMPIETWVLSFALGLGFLNFLMILLGKMGILFTKITLAVSVLGIIAALTLLSMLLRKWLRNTDVTAVPPKSIWSFSKKQSWLFVVLLVLTVLIKTVYLSHAILPTSTDLGHHMYWSKLIAETGTLPLYAKQDIVTDDNGTYTITAPEPIADFIIGEHLPFSAINILSGIDFFSAFPILFLLLINLMSLLALVTLARTMATHIRSVYLSEQIFTPQNIALATLFIFGPLYSLASPQAKFVSGGVVGNVFGNLFIPLILFAYLRAFREKRSDFLAIGFFLTFTLAYIHHLSTLMLLFILGASVIVYLAFHWNTLGTTLRAWGRLFFQWKPLIIAFAACLFFFFVALPTYIETQAVGTALGTPTKTTRTGLSWYQVTFSSGEARVAFGIAGLLLIAFLRTRTRYASAFLLGWGGVLLIMTLYPHFLFINIPSNRIGAYLSFPLGILAAFALIGVLALLHQRKKHFFVPGVFLLFLTLSSFVFTTGSGSYDNGQTLLPESKALPVLQTFAASRYLAAHVTDDDIVLKDHNYIVGDAWMKLFFLRDYSYPLSRGFFKRYEDNPNREQCTLLMISVPNTARGEKCYTETGTNLVVVNPNYDVTPFEKSPSFYRLYASPDIHIYARTQ